MGLGRRTLVRRRSRSGAVSSVCRTCVCRPCRTGSGTEVGQRAAAVMMGYARGGGDFSLLFLWDTSRIFRAPSVCDFQGGIRNSYNTRKNRVLDGASFYIRNL